MKADVNYIEAALNEHTDAFNLAHFGIVPKRVEQKPSIADWRAFVQGHNARYHRAKRGKK